MDDELKQLEDELRHFKPVGSSSALLERIERDLRPKRRLFPVWAPLPGLIALGVGALIVFKQPSSAGAGVPAFKPVSANSVVLKSSDDGYITLTDGSVAKETRRSSVDTITWTDSASHASLTWSVPREDVTVTPVSYQ